MVLAIVVVFREIWRSDVTALNSGDGMLQSWSRRLYILEDMKSMADNLADEQLD